MLLLLEALPSAAPGGGVRRQHEPMNEQTDEITNVRTDEQRDVSPFGRHLQRNYVNGPVVSYWLPSTRTTI